jgi:hypothetical protein
MSEKIAKLILTKFLGEYLENIDSEHIGVGVNNILIINIRFGQVQYHWIIYKLNQVPFINLIYLYKYCMGKLVKLISLFLIKVF